MKPNMKTAADRFIISFTPVHVDGCFQAEHGNIFRDWALEESIQGEGEIEERGSTKETRRLHGYLTFQWTQHVHTWRRREGRETNDARFYGRRDAGTEEHSS